MDWPISEVARMSGVTARTLRHYDETGLLPPSRIGANGHRYYEEHQLLLLQQILVLRALGVGLPEIGRILAEQVDEVDALREHHRRLLAERDRLDALAGTVSRTIAELEQSRKDGNPMTIHRPENLFEGVQPSQYAENMRDFPELAEEVGRRAAAMSQADADAGHRERTAQMIRLAELMAAGHPADAEPVQAEIDAQYRALTQLRAVSVEEYRAIGRACVDNDAWRTAYEAIAPGLSAYQRDAIEAYATTGLD
ncbi:MerR family transcriptional regulator [Streptomyces sp. NPDC058657]|uniref:MerR family transcriptional regulator n=1 Tax=unclassified Streptomyces TaxID=2593676 RepID=UPI00364DD6D7